MSTMFVSDLHISVLVYYAIEVFEVADGYTDPKYGDITRDLDAYDALGQMLVDQNLAVINRRYSCPEDIIQHKFKYKFDEYFSHLKPMQIIAICEIYYFQLNYIEEEISDEYKAKTIFIINKIILAAMCMIEKYDNVSFYMRMRMLKDQL